MQCLALHKCMGETKMLTGSNSFQNVIKCFASFEMFLLYKKIKNWSSSFWCPYLLKVFLLEMCVCSCANMWAHRLMNEYVEIFCCFHLFWKINLTHKFFTYPNGLYYVKKSYSFFIHLFIHPVGHIFQHYSYIPGAMLSLGYIMVA